MPLVSTYDPVQKRIVYKQVDGPAQTASVELPQLSVGPAANANSPAAPSMTMGPQPFMQAAVSPAPFNSLSQKLSQLEQERGLPQGYLAQTRAVESSNGRNLSNPNSSARGPYQFIDSTANSMGLSMADRMDEIKSATAAADMAQSNMASFRKRMGYNPTGADLYGMHQQGGPGFLKILGGQAPGGEAQSLNGGAGLSASGFADKIRSMYNNARPDIPGDPTTKYGNGGGATMNNTGINQVSPLITQKADTGVDNSTMPQAPIADPSKQSYNGGIMGLLQGGDYSGAGSSKDLSGKLADFTGSSAFTGGVKGLMSALGGGQQPALKAPGIQPTGDDENKPNMALLQQIMARYSMAS